MEQNRVNQKQADLKRGDQVRFCGLSCEVVSIDQHGVRLRRVGRRWFRPPVWRVPAECIERVSQRNGEI